MLLAIALVFVASVLLTWIIRRYALNYGLLDQPNVRSAHNQPTPRGGGGAFVVSFLLVFWLSSVDSIGLPRPPGELLVGLGVGGGLVALVGFADDRRHVAVYWRLLVHGAAALLVVWQLLPLVNAQQPFYHWWLWLGGVWFIVWLLNLFNFMDGIDGIAGVEAISVALAASLTMLAQRGSLPDDALWLLLLAAGAAGFLVWNWPPARIFMGDGGSGFLGFALAVLALHSVLRGDMSIWSWLILLGVFLVDSTWTLLRRMLRGATWYRAHSSHAYQILSRQRVAAFSDKGIGVEHARALGQRWVVYRLGFINLFWLFPLALLAAHRAELGPPLLLLAWAPLLFLVVRLGAGRD